MSDFEKYKIVEGLNTKVINKEGLIWGVIEGDLLTLLGEDDKDFIEYLFKSYDINQVETQLELHFILEQGVDMRVTPDYYKGGEFEPSYFINKYDLNFNIGSIFKYVVRIGKKTKDKTKDHEKILNYFDIEMERIVTGGVTSRSFDEIDLEELYRASDEWGINLYQTQTLKRLLLLSINSKIRYGDLVALKEFWRRNIDKI